MNDPKATYAWCDARFGADNWSLIQSLSLTTEEYCYSFVFCVEDVMLSSVMEFKLMFG